MDNNLNPSSGNRPGRSRLPFSRRTIGILIMVAGAFAFFYSQIRFEDNLLCLGGSTLVVFAGLVFILAGRRAPVGGISEGSQDRLIRNQPEPVFRRRVPPGLRQETRRRTQYRPPSMVSTQTDPAPSSIRNAPVVQPNAYSDGQDALLGQVIAFLNEQGAQVVIETQRADSGGSRSILQVQSQDGRSYTFMVLEELAPVNVADVRALAALVNSSGSTAGYLIASAPFSPNAYEWAGARHIHLVREDELEELSL